MEFIIKVLKGQTMAFYRALAAKTLVPRGDPNYWGSDYAGTKPNDQEWRDAADDLFGAALQAGVFTATGTPGPAGPAGPIGTPGASLEQVAGEIARRLSNG